MDNQTVQNISDLIKAVSMEHGIHIQRMILYGSRARGDFRFNSDYDFIAITDASVSHQKKMELWLYISRALSEIDVTADILFKSELEFEADKSNKGKVTYYAAKEGVMI